MRILSGIHGACNKRLGELGVFLSCEGGWSLFTGLIGGLFITMTVAVIVPPKILRPTDGTIRTIQGESCRINCTARTMFPKFYIVYWLVNDTFIEDTFLDGRVQEEEESIINNNGPSYEVTKALVFTSTQPEDFTRTFTCVVQDPAGVDTKNITLAPKAEETTTTQEPKDQKKHNRKTRSKRNKKEKKQDAGQ